ncbi:MAG: polysaccharide deacetylase family protein [Deltaproteobacteria bacterium]|nr:polysaccharide deacetylase family protein [Deltaproteobacteria bacterium]
MINEAYEPSSEGLIIYLFHGVLDTPSKGVTNAIRKHIEKEYFEAVLKNALQSGTPLSMDEVLQIKQERRRYPPRSFAVTFDDGFENNYSVAAPILEELNIPATFYVTTDYVDRNLMSWIDRIEYCLETATEGRVTLPWESNARRFKGDSEKLEILNEIRLRVKSDASIEVTTLVSQIFHQCGVPVVSQLSDQLNKKMSWEQVRRLHGEKLFTIGGHSHSHPILAFLSGPRLREEIETSIRLLKERAGIESRHYAYPEGKAHHYNESVIAVLKEHGIICCPSAIEGINSGEEDLFDLKRTMVV